MIIQYTVDDVLSWQRDKVTARGGRARTYRPAGDAEAKELHASAARHAFYGSDATAHIRSRDQWAVHVIYSPKDERAHDTDRVLTLVLDALTGVVWHDDNDKFVRRSSCEVVRGDGLYPPGTTTVCIERVAGPYVAKKNVRVKKGAS